jgi:hypothetical protein
MCPYLYACFEYFLNELLLQLERRGEERRVKEPSPRSFKFN